MLFADSMSSRASTRRPRLTAARARPSGVAVEVRVERVAHERVDLDGLALDQHRLERLESPGGGASARFRSTGCSWMTSSRTSQTSGIIESTIFLAALMFWTALRSTSRAMMNGTKSSRAISFGRPHWWIFRLGAGHDDRAARVVHALAEQVLAEAALLALQHVAERLERAVARPGHGPAAAAVVEQRVDGLLASASRC